jgi:peptidoglycan/xylan/chitin deacetylase (PgdA/CDA1 family)
LRGAQRRSNLVAQGRTTTLKPTLFVLLAAGLAAHSPAPHRPARTVAITIDDVPWTGGDETAAARRAGTARMVAALRTLGAPAAVFVNCARLHRPDPLIELWIAAGATIGNHTAHHLNLNTTSLAEWRGDVRSCDAALRETTGRPVRFFRFPMLHEGETAEQVSAARAVLRELAYRNAHVTIDNSDATLVRPYSVALARGDVERARTLAAAALAHDLEATRHFESVARRKAGREIPQIILLHANAMTAAILDPLLDSLRQRGYRFVSLEAALGDPVYRRPTCYTGRQGLSFLYRIAPCAAGQDAWDLAAQEKLQELAGQP